MSSISQLQFYLARVNQARTEGEAATLNHVRERCQRSEAAWQEMADRASRADAMRAKLLREKLACSLV